MNLCCVVKKLINIYGLIKVRIFWFSNGGKTFGK